MHLSPNDDPMSIFADGKLKPGTYKVQNLASDTYLEWEFQTSGSGYNIKKVDPGKPDQFCNVLGVVALLGLGGVASAAAFPTAWRVEVVDDIKHRGFGYVRIFWGSTNKALSLSWWGSREDGTKVGLSQPIAAGPWRMWKLIPVQDENPRAGSDVNKYEAPPTYSSK